MTAISSKAVAAKAAAKSAAEDLQGDTDESAAVTQSQMPVDVAAQLQQAQQLAQQQAADFKQNNEGSTTRLDTSGSTTASAGSTLGLGTGSSSAADPTALSADASTMDPAEKLQLAQQHQSQQAATFKQNNEGTAARLDTASNAAAAAAASAAAAGITNSQLESASKGAVSSSNNTGSGVAAGGLPDVTDQLNHVEGTKSTSDTGLNSLGQTANAADATKSLGKSADGSNTSTDAAAASNAAAMGANDSKKKASSSDSAATGGDSQLVVQSQEAGQQQGQQVSSVKQDASADTQTQPTLVSVTR